MSAALCPSSRTQAAVLSGWGWGGYRVCHNGQALAPFSPREAAIAAVQSRPLTHAGRPLLTRRSAPPSQTPADGKQIHQCQRHSLAGSRRLPTRHRRASRAPSRTSPRRVKRVLVERKHLLLRNGAQMSTTCVGVQFSILLAWQPSGAARPRPPW